MFRISLTLARIAGSATLLLFLLSLSALQITAQNNTTDAFQHAHPVTLTVTVTNAHEELITGLTQADFSVLADKVPQKITYFSDEDKPASVGILFDVSGSMSTRRGLAVMKAYKDALGLFFAQSHRSNDYFLLSFDLKPELLVDWTSDGDAILNGLNSVEFKGNTAFYDACYAGIEKVAQGRYEKRVIILISDGQDNTSTHTRDQMRRLLGQYNLLIYSINIFADDDAIASSLNDEGQSILNELARMSGGMTFYRNQNQRVTLGSLRSVLGFIADELHHQYLIGFVPSTNEAKDHWQRIKLKLTGETNDARLRGLTVRSRESYYITNP